MRFFRPRSRPGRLAFTAAALLAGCSTIGPPIPPPTPWEIAGATEPVVMLRVLPGDPGAPPTAARYLLAEGDAWAPDTGSGYATPLLRPSNVPSEAAGTDGWLAVALGPGRQLLRIRASPGAPAQDFMITVPSQRAAVYAGSFRRDCAEDQASCRLVPLAAEDQAAREAVPAPLRAAFPVVAVPAQPYPPRLAGSALLAPTAPAIRVDAVSWLSAVDWQTLLGDSGEIPEPPAGDFSSSSSGFEAIGMVMVLGAFIAIAVPVALVALIARSEGERRQRVAAEAARTRSEALQARAEAARAAWSPCEATIGAALAPDRVARHLDASFPRPRAGRQAAAPWQATVTRVVLRHCGQDPGTFGVEVATEWTGEARGAAAPAYRASFVRPVDAATPDTRLRWSNPPPWEVPVAPAGACRPLAEWCAAGGRALLDEIANSVAGARDAIAATR